MQITIGSAIKITNVPFKLRGILTKKFMFPNPAYTKAKQRRRPTWGMDKNIPLYSWDGLTLWFGRGLLSELSDILEQEGYKLGKDYIFVDERMDKYSMDYGPLLGELRPYQSRAVNDLAEVHEGIFEAPPGSGKTFTGMALIQRIKQPALWITHTEDLMYQADKASKILRDIGKVGLIYSKEKSVGDKLTIVSVKTLYNRPDLIDAFNRYIGLVIIDEAHHVPANTFLEVVFKLKAKYVYGLTATPYRPDGLHPLMHATIGNVVSCVTRDTLYEEGYLIKPKIVPVYTNFRYTQASHRGNNSVDAGGEDFNYYGILTNLYADEERIKLVVMNILEQANKQESYQLVLINNKMYLNKVYDVLVDLYEKMKAQDSTQAQIKAAIFTADLSSKERPRLLQAILDKQYNVIFATQLAKEGLDIPHLNVAHLVTPRKGDVWNKEGELTGLGLEQEVGRIQRPYTNKDSQNTTIYDYVDHLVGVFNTQFATRRAVYKRLGLTVPRKPRNIEDDAVSNFIKNMNLNGELV